jgi:chromosome segregation protein
LTEGFVLHFTRLRLQGFKSFVDPVDLEIGAGMTGIVGPNGCGKSNLVEALRWVMGETSAKSMRGTDMDDVIFGGTAMRPARDLAEVTLTLDNSDRTAMAELNNADDLVVFRKIERNRGSDYRVNGRPVRLKDVQLLFADQSTGAHSTSVVGQGQIDALIRAKPTDRRRILEEASGTSGLQARRHEAELKLKAADQNLTRVDDVMRTQEAQLKSLKQQVRQASRYRNLAEHIRKTEAALMRLRWSEAEKDAAKVAEALAEAEKRVTELLSVVTQATTARTESAAELPGLRQAEAVAAAVLQKLSLAREQAETEAKRIDDEIATTEERIRQTWDDHGREKSRLTDGLAAEEKLAAEAVELTKKNAQIAESLPGLRQDLATTTDEVATLDATLADLMREAATAEAKEQALAREIDSLSTRHQSLSTRRAAIEAERTALAAEIAARPDLSLATAMVEACETELARRQQQATDAEQARHDAETTRNAARDVVLEKRAALTQLSAEADAIRSLLRHQDATTDQVIDLIDVTPGLEQALAVALGEALTAALDPKAAMHWRELPALTASAPLPAGATALADFVKAPAALARSLSQIGLVDGRAEGEAVAAALNPGQIIVSRDGWAWRWDGFTLSPEAKTASAMRLQQRNRLAALEADLVGAQANVAEAEAAADQAATLFTECQSLDQQARNALKAAFTALADARSLYAKREREAEAANAKLATLDNATRQLVVDLEQIRARATAAEQERAELPVIDALRVDITAKRVGLAEARGLLAQQQAECSRLAREEQIAKDRLAAIANERKAWQDRRQSAEAQTQALAARLGTYEKELADLRGKPATLAATLDGLRSQLTEAEAKRRDAADRLIAAEQALSVIEHQLKKDETTLGEARETRVRAEAAVAAADEHFVTLRERIAEKLNATPDELATIAAQEGGVETASIFELEQALGRYVRERDNMGPVNLRAEVEAETLQNDMTKIASEKDDLVAAIAKLRQGISHLNREARERLNNAFGQVNERFQKLFTGLFNGGKAYLELIDNDDPMNAGLEIFASPPGKKMQVLSLLSGGERTLTALALLFAVFQTNPSPICVLDEAEAALDESNIERFCKLVSSIAEETSTRFLIITHQRMTMAHMDRLFGVTMSEKGVSQLVSVDLKNAVALRDGKEIAVDALKEVQAA